MKNHYKLLFLCLIIFNSLGLKAKNNETTRFEIFNKKYSLVLAPITATISGTATVCLNASQPSITFTASGGTAPYTFTYKIGSDPTQTITTTGVSTTATISANTSASGIFTYTLVSVHDATTPVVEELATGDAIITVNALPTPDANLGSSADFKLFNNIPAYTVCSNAISSEFTFTNISSTTATNTKYKINWGDSSTDFDSSTWSTLKHTYSLGLWNLTYTIENGAGCKTEKKYIIFVGSNPAVSLGNPGNTDICNSQALTFPITGTTDNPPGTTYIITFNDGSMSEVYNHPPPATVTHTFSKTSCGTNSTSGSGTVYANSYSANIKAQNPCGSSEVGVVPIYVSISPVADFSSPEKECTNKTVTLSNTSKGSYETNGNAACNTSPKMVWSISPATGFTVTSGSLGNDFGSNSPNSWLNGSQDVLLNFTQPGTYTITLKAGNRCGYSTKVKTICIETPLAPQFTLNTNTGCTPLAITTTNTTDTTNACTPPTYTWSVSHTQGLCASTTAIIANQTTKDATFNFTETGTYTIKLTTTNACGTYDTTQTVTVKKPPTVAINTITNACGPTIINPVATINSCAPASSILTYAWSFPGGTPATANTANPGAISYTGVGDYIISLTVSNECGVTIAANQIFSIKTPPTIDGNLISCVGFSSQLTGSGTPAVTNPWASATPAVATTNASGLITSVSAGTTAITYTDINNCKATKNFTVNPAPTITPLVSNAICQGGTLAPLSFTITGASGTPTYQWYSNTTENNTTGVEIAGETNTSYTPPFTNLGTTYYYCVIALPTGGCTSIKTNIATISILPNATISKQPTATQNLCIGVTIPTPLTFSNIGGTTTPSYQWYLNTTNSNTTGTPISGATANTYSPPVFTLASNYYYYAIVTPSGSGCLPTTTNLSEIIVYPDPTITIQPTVKQDLCQGATPTKLDVVASGGNGPFSYQWYSNTTNNNSGGQLLVGETANSYTPITTAVGTQYYYCVVNQTSTPGCTATTATATVKVIAAPTINKQPQSSTICLGETPTELVVSYINEVGTTSYQWFSNNTNSIGGTAIPILGATNNNYTPPSATTGTVYYYCVISLSTGGCSVLTSSIATITINQRPVIAPKTVLIRSGQSFNITPDNLNGDIVPTGTTYTWSIPTIVPSATVVGASAQGVAQTSISQTLMLTDTATTPAIVTYTVTPLSGTCTGANFTVTVTVNPNINPNISFQNSSCFNGNTGLIQTSISGGAPFATGAPYRISWTGPNGYTASTATISNLKPGDYSLLITDAGGSPYNETITISQPNELTIVTDLQKNIKCFNNRDGEIKITASGGTPNYSYSWTKNGSAFASTKDISNLDIGTYIVKVSDANNCGPKTSTFVITQPPNLTVNLANKTDLLCYNKPTGTITVNTNGGTAPYNYSWSGPNNYNNTNQNISTLLAGSYSLIITDNVGCTTNLSTTITQNTEIKITATTTPIKCYGDDNGTITIAIAGGISPYGIGWSNLATGTYQENLSGGDYDVTITDALNCVQPKRITIATPPVFAINPVVKDIDCYGNKNGSINLNFIGGVNPIKLVWDDNPIAGTTRNNLTAGSYAVTITDNQPCKITKTFTINEPQAIALSSNLTHALSCTDANSGAIDLLVAGGSTPFTYSWSNGATTEDLTNIPSGNYWVTVTDAKKCPKQAQFNVNRQPEININVLTKTTFDCDNKNIKQTFEAQVAGGVPGYTLAWSSGTISGPNNEFMNTNQDGTVNLLVTDAIGCSNTYSLNVTVPKLGNPSFNASSYANLNYGFYSINDPIQFTNTATDGFIAISWDFGDGVLSTELNPKHVYSRPNEYVVTQKVTYLFGCVYEYKITVNVEKGYVLTVPTAFTPNTDGLNDYFRPITKALKNVQLDVYDSWGSLIYSEKGETLVGWDAQIKGLNAENGNYFCKVSGETFYGTTVHQDHPFVLIK